MGSNPATRTKIRQNLVVLTDFFLIIKKALDKYWYMSWRSHALSCAPKKNYTILLFVNPPNVKIHQINAPARTSFTTIPTLVLD